MDIIRKDATITNTDEEGSGSFEVVLSAPTKDRDGETLLPEDWKQPLPDHITFDSDHGMTVATTVGSGIPRIDDETGNLVVAGTYSSLPRAQEVRTLVNEGHIRTTSVAFMTEKSEKDGKTVATRELLNGAFVAIPSNREALVLASKGVKAGARNSASDLTALQTIHDTATVLGAECSGAKSLAGALSAAELRALTQPDPDLTELRDAVQKANAFIRAVEGSDVTPDEETAESTAATEAAKAAEVTAAADADIQTRVRALTLSASIYTD